MRFERAGSQGLFNALNKMKAKGHIAITGAQGVIAFLLPECNVPVRPVVAPGAMGEAQPAASNETKSGRAENRRVEVKVLVNKGISGS